MSNTGMPSVIHNTSLTPESAASRIASVAKAAGTITNEVSATFKVNNQLFNRDGSLIDNAGSMSVTHELFFPALLHNEAGGRLLNRLNATLTISNVITERGIPTVTNDEVVENDGAIDIGGVLQNNSVVCGTGTITGNGVNGNPPVVTCPSP